MPTLPYSPTVIALRVVKTAWRTQVRGPDYKGTCPWDPEHFLVVRGKALLSTGAGRVGLLLQVFWNEPHKQKVNVAPVDWSQADVGGGVGGGTISPCPRILFPPFSAFNIPIFSLMLCFLLIALCQLLVFRPRLILREPKNMILTCGERIWNTTTAPSISFEDFWCLRLKTKGLCSIHKFSF